AAGARVEAPDLVHDAFADPLVAGERDENAGLDRSRFVLARDSICERVDAEQSAVRLEHPHGTVSGRDRSLTDVAGDRDRLEAAPAELIDPRDLGMEVGREPTGAERPAVEEPDRAEAEGDAATAGVDAERERAHGLGGFHVASDQPRVLFADHLPEGSVDRPEVCPVTAADR